MTDAMTGLDACVHCGFCLQSCPTYLATGDEADSPRGRIVLMRQLASGDLTPSDPQLAYHLDRCLGCRACESACPSGVVYGPALEHTRASMLEVSPLPLAATAVLATMAEPRLRRPILRASRLLRPLARFLAGSSRLGFLMGMLGATKALQWLDDDEGFGTTVRQRAQPFELPPVKPPNHQAAVVFAGCIMEGLFSHVNAATERTLRVNGFDLREAPSQGCCGALHAHAGRHGDALRLARANVAAFSALPDSKIVVNSAGCGAILKDYGRLLSDDPFAEDAARFSERVVDVSEALAEVGPLQGSPLEMKVAMDPPCHLQHAQRVIDAPLTLISAIPGLDCLTPQDSGQCCGSAGIYSLLEPKLSRDVLDRKLQSLRALSPDVIATGNPGCIMQIGAGILAGGDQIPVVHPIELLDLSYRRMQHQPTD